MDLAELQDKIEKLEKLQRSGQRLKLDNLEHTTDNMDHRYYRDKNLKHLLLNTAYEKGSLYVNFSY